MGATIESRHDVVPGSMELPNQLPSRSARVADHELHARNIQGVSTLTNPTIMSTSVFNAIFDIHGPSGTRIVQNDVLLAVHCTHTSNKETDVLEIVSKERENPVRHVVRYLITFDGRPHHSSA